MNIQFDDTFFQDIGKPNYTQDQRDVFEEDFLTELDVRVTLRAIEGMDEVKAEEINKLLENSEYEQAKGMMRKLVPNYEDIAKEELQKLKDDVKSGAIDFEPAEKAALESEDENEVIASPAPPPPPGYNKDNAEPTKELEV